MKIFQIYIFLDISLSLNLRLNLPVHRNFVNLEKLHLAASHTEYILVSYLIYILIICL